MKKEERDKRNEAIKLAYQKEMNSSYIKGESQSGSAYRIERIAKKYGLTVSAIYQILTK